MITNELEYRVAIESRRVLNAAIHSTEDQQIRNTEEYELLREGAISKLHKLDKEIAQYETLRDGAAAEFYVDFDDIDEAFILARHLRHMSQQELGDKLGVKQQQIQRYETRNYEQATLARLRDVAWALNCNIRLVVQLKNWGAEQIRDSVGATATPTGSVVTLERARALSHSRDAIPVMSASVTYSSGGGEPLAAR